jgi:hypothetical protein
VVARLGSLNLNWFRLGFWAGISGAAALQFFAAADQVAMIGVSTPPAPNATVSLGWTASPSTNVTGYYLNWGLASGNCTNRLDVGNVVSTTIGGLSTNTTYYFNIVAYDAGGDQAPPSNELAYLATCAPAGSPSPLLLFQCQPTNANAAAVSINFQGSAGAKYLVQATQDFQQWTTIFTTNCLSDGPVLYQAVDSAGYASRFYRVQRQ